MFNIVQCVIVDLGFVNVLLIAKCSEENSSPQLHISGITLSAGARLGTSVYFSADYYYGAGDGSSLLRI